MKTSVHFNAAMASADRHNRREKELKYVRAELTPNNQYSERFTTSVNEAKEDAQQRYRANHFTTKTTHRKMKDGSIKDYQKKVHKEMPKNATPIKEAVIVLSPEATMLQLEQLADRWKDKYGISVKSISIHEDEGHIDRKTGEWQPNRHAHLVADFTDEKGEQIQNRLNYEDRAAISAGMQTDAAEVLHMERGQAGSAAVRLEAMNFKALKKLEEIRQLEEENKELTAANKAAKANAVAHLSNFVNKLVGKDPVKARDAEIAKLKEELNKKNTEIRQLNAAVGDLKAKVEELQVKVTEGLQRLKEWHITVAQVMKENVNKSFQNFIDESLRFTFNINAICKMWAGQILNVRDKSCDIYANGKLLGSERWNKWRCEKEKGYLVRDGDWVFHAKEQAALEKNQAQKNNQEENQSRSRGIKMG